jgi:hypothetical protein
MECDAMIAGHVDSLVCDFVLASIDDCTLVKKEALVTGTQLRSILPTTAAHTTHAATPGLRRCALGEFAILEPGIRLSLRNLSLTVLIPNVVFAITGLRVPAAIGHDSATYPDRIDRFSSGRRRCLAVRGVIAV